MKKIKEMNKKRIKFTITNPINYKLKEYKKNIIIY